MKEIKKEQISCHDCEMAIIAGTAEGNAAAQQHLQHCAACREFAVFQASVLAAADVGKFDPPGFSQISSAMRQQKRLRRNYLRFMVVPMAAAAAAVLAVGGVFLHLRVEKSPVELIEYSLMADSQAFAAALQESTISLAWDQVSSSAAACSASVNDARQSGDWSIELFNPYNEDLL